MMSIVTEQDEKKISESWLDETYGVKLEAIRAAVKELYDLNSQRYYELPFYTPHGLQHCQAVENLIHKLIQGDSFKELSMKERYYLLASAWLHDLGMLNYVYRLIYRDEHATASQIRKIHQITSAKYIVEYWSSLKLNEEDKEILAKLCRFHRLREDLNDCEEFFYVGNSRYRLRLLAAYLRLADALDICSSRVPSESYAICLAYNIPDESKLHWIKSKIINGIFLDEKEHKIYIQFKFPESFNLEEKFLLKRSEEKLNSILKIVLNDLRAELASVMNVLTRAGISYYLDIEVRRSEVTYDDQMLNDLRDIVINYDIIMAPSASRLLDIILVTIANVIGFSLVKNDDYKQIKFSNNIEIKNTRPKLINFIEILENDILAARPCHLGLRKLIRELSNYIREAKSSEELIDKINDLYQKHHGARSMIREQSRQFFNNNTSSDSGEKNKIYNILLYGYSELAVKTICGLRDSLIAQQYEHLDPKDLYNSAIEERFSQRINIFICDGQPKTQTGFMDRLIYHDASQYALFLKERGFTNLIIIPDIISGTIMKCCNIDFIFVGANGITDCDFIHSAGHYSLIKLAKSTTVGRPMIILITTTEKKMDTTENHQRRSHQPNNVQDVEGFKVMSLINCSPNRQHIWMVKDKALMDKLYNSDIMFANLREDRIQIKEIDYIITEKGFCKSTDSFDTIGL